jgi:hypothetical protein
MDSPVPLNERGVIIEKELAASALKGATADEKARINKKLAETLSSVEHYFEYKYPNGYRGENHTRFPKGLFKGKVGDFYLWVPADLDDRKLQPGENLQVPMIVEPSCKYMYIVDRHTPASEIQGIASPPQKK